MAGTATVTNTSTLGVGIRKLSIAWTSTAGGAVSGNTIAVKTGTLIRAIFIPGAGGAQPTDLYDATLLDPNGIDLLAGQGANLSNSAASAVQPAVLIAPGNLQLVIANAGNAKSGTVELYIGSPSLAAASVVAATGGGAATIADGANVTQGAKADAKSTATDTTPVSIMSVLKQISASVQGLITPSSLGQKTAANSTSVVLSSDGPFATNFGTTTDAKNTATDTTAVSAMSVWKQISASVQLFVFGAGTAAAAQRVTHASDDPAVATLGATTGAKVITDANGTIQQYLRGLVSQWVAGTLTLASQAYSASATFTPAASSHTTPAVNGGAQQFSTMGPASGRILITGASLEIDGASAEASAWRLYLYNVTPPSATADAGAWDLVSGDRASHLGYIDLGTAVDLGSTQWVETSGINKQVALAASGNLFGYLVNLTTLTPAAVAHIVTLHSVAL
jgi:hypothetical protein